MRRALSLMLCLAAAWLLYGLAMELFIAWYSGSEYESQRIMSVAYFLQAAVNAIAMVAGWRWFRRRPRPVA